jgi:uncharacterized membrane protein
MTKTNKKTNKEQAVQETVPSSNPLTSQLIALVCLIGAFSQLLLSFKIIFVDREFPTLALSLVFFIIFTYGFFTAVSKTEFTKKWFLIQLIVVISLDVVCFGLMAILMDKKAEIITAGIGALAFTEALPLVLLIAHKGPKTNGH